MYLGKKLNVITIVRNKPLNLSVATVIQINLNNDVYDFDLKASLMNCCENSYFLGQTDVTSNYYKLLCVFLLYLSM